MKEELKKGYWNAPIGVLEIGYTPKAIHTVRILQSEDSLSAEIFSRSEALLHSEASVEDPIFSQCIRELEAYFNGTLTRFTVPLAPAGTLFQQEVWRALQEIPYGATCSYAELATQIGKPKACRAVGNANNRNPIMILIPCHRVVGTDGSLTGYAGGLNVKRWLLNHEFQPTGVLFTLFS